MKIAGNRSGKYPPFQNASIPGQNVSCIQNERTSFVLYSRGEPGINYLHVRARKSRSPENWDAAREGYAERVAPLLMEPFVDELVDRLDADENTEALEVAAGSGALTAHLAPRVKSLLAADFSPRMVETLESRMRPSGVTNVTCALMDGQALQVDDASFDRAACSLG